MTILTLASSACREEQPPRETDAPLADASPRTDVSTPSCGTSAGAAVDGGGIGDLQVGRHVDAIRQACRVAEDTVVRDIEGNPQRVLKVVIVRDTVAAEVNSDTVVRLSIRSPGMRTRDSLGVGTKLSTLLRYADVTAATGEGQLFALVPAHCGLSFQLAAKNWTTRDLRTLPDTVSVTRILAFGCHA